MLKIFDYLDEVIAQEKVQEQDYPQWAFTASEIMYELGYRQAGMEKEPLDRAMHACAVMQIPIEYNFKKVYCYKDGEMTADWQLSNLATYLFMINCNPINPIVAKAQLIYMHKDQI